LFDASAEAVVNGVCAWKNKHGNIVDVSDRGKTDAGKVIEIRNKAITTI
jgi:hypothetical protein